jgi:hypothetical protein
MITQNLISSFFFAIMNLFLFVFMLQTYRIKQNTKKQEVEERKNDRATKFSLLIHIFVLNSFMYFVLRLHKSFRIKNQVFIIHIPYFVAVVVVIYIYMFFLHFYCCFIITN